jgi:cytochrome oxidase assembly protein ShyY1
VPVTEVLRVGRPAGERAEWTRVTATGTYLPEASVVVRYQTRDGASGVDVVTPLRTSAGPLLVVDRGWMRTGNTGGSGARPPAPPGGRVTVVGFVRADATGDSAAVADGTTRAVSSREIAKDLDEPVLAGFVDAEKETPPPGTPLVPVERPDLGTGPHFFYGLQWWFFGVLAVVGFGYLVYDERRRLARGETPGSRRPAAGRTRSGPRRPPPATPASGSDQTVRSMPPSTGTITPVTNDAAGLSRNAATRPNSSGRP